MGVRGSLRPSLFTPSPTNTVENIVNRLMSIALDAGTTTNIPLVSKTGGVHVFDIMARILKDNRLKNRGVSADFFDQFLKTLHECPPIVREHAEQWTVDLHQPGEIERKTEELVWLSSLVYGVGGLTSNGHQFDFVLCVTSITLIFL